MSHMVSDAFLSIPINQKCQILSFDSLVANEPYGFRCVSFYTNKSKMPNFEFWHSCRKWAIWFPTRFFLYNNTKMPDFEFWHSCCKWAIWFPTRLCPTHSYVATYACVWLTISQNYRSLWDGMILYGTWYMIWYGMTWYDMIWYDMIW